MTIVRCAQGADAILTALLGCFWERMHGRGLLALDNNPVAVRSEKSK